MSNHNQQIETKPVKSTLGHQHWCYAFVKRLLCFVLFFFTFDRSLFDHFKNVLRVQKLFVLEVQASWVPWPQQIEWGQRIDAKGREKWEHADWQSGDVTSSHRANGSAGACWSRVASFNLVCQSNSPPPGGQHKTSERDQGSHSTYIQLLHFLTGRVLDITAAGHGWPIGCDMLVHDENQCTS